MNRKGINQHLSWFIMSYFAAQEKDKLFLWNTFSSEVYLLVPWNLLSATILSQKELETDRRPGLQNKRQSCLLIERTCQTWMSEFFKMRNTKKWGCLSSWEKLGPYISEWVPEGAVRMWALMGVDFSHWATGRVPSLKCPFFFCTVEVRLIALTAG